MQLEKSESDAQRNCCWVRLNMPMMPETNPMKMVEESPRETQETPPSKLGIVVIMLGWLPDEPPVLLVLNRAKVERASLE